MKNFIIVLITIFTTAQSVTAQDQDGDFDDLMNMSLEELMQVEVYSVSKKKESLFEAPLSSSIITSQDILNAGVTNIPEALRLIPGLIVREISNGNYDVHIRGLDNLNRYTDASTGGNQITLVMVDSRPVFNNNTGGVFWETIPVDLIDIERIEVVRGPAAALYGPNAVSGVVNIITKNNKEVGFYSSALINQGMTTEIESATTTAGVSLGYKASEKWNVRLSANLQNRNRLDDEYFSFYDNEYVILDSLKSTYALNQGDYLSKEQVEYAFPIGNESLNKFGTNLFLNYSPNDWLDLNFQSGYQNASSQRIYRQNPYTPHSVLKLESYYANLQMKAAGFTGRVSYINGEDNVNSLPFFLPTGDTITIAYTYENVDGYLEYDWEALDNLTIVPGLSYQRSTYSDELLDSNPTQLGLVSGKKTIRTFSASVRGDYQPLNNLRLIAAARVDQFTVPNDYYISYEMAAAYTLNKNNMFRAVVSRSNSGAFMAQTSLEFNKDYSLATPFGTFQGTARFNGNENIELFQLQLFELGYRSRLLENLEFDLELFHQRSKNSNEVVNDEIPEGYFADISTVQVFSNLPLKARQWGATLSLNYLPVNSLSIKPFITFQNTKTEDFPEAFNTPERNAASNINNTNDVENTQTPDAYGGLIVNYKPTAKWNINYTGYYLHQHLQFNEYDEFNRFSTAGTINTNMINNLNVTYTANKYIKLNLNARNLTNNQNREYYGADRKAFILMGGLSVSL